MTPCRYARDACRRCLRWMRRREHISSGHWTALLPSTTPASQAGILHGNNDGIPNFRWCEKRDRPDAGRQSPRGRHRASSRRISNGEGLLSARGRQRRQPRSPATRPRSFMVMSTNQGPRSGGLGESEPSRLVLRQPVQLHQHDRPATSPRSSRRTSSRGASSARGIVPRMHRRDFPYPFVRAATNVALRALGTSLVIAGDVPRHAGHLPRLHRLRRDRPPQRAGTARIARRPRRRRSRDRASLEKVAARRRRGHIASSSSPTTARASARPSSSATA